MTTMAVPTAVAQGPSGSRLRWTLGDAATLTWRNLKGLTRIPDAIFFATLQPIMFVLLFRFVFGGAISIPGVSYVDYLMPGIFVQTVAFGAVSTAVGLADDLQKGLIERFRALPMARSAVLAGRTALIRVDSSAVEETPGWDGYIVKPFLRLRRGLGLRRRGPDRVQPRDGPAHGLPDPLPADLRLLGLRPGVDHAGLAAGLRQAPTGDPGG